MSFNIFGPASQDVVRVGYISTDRGFVDGVSVCEANDYAKSNPGTQFIFKTRDFIKYLNINEVNQLTPNDLVSAGNTCSGIKFESECGPAQAYFYGGGGVGVQGNPVVGEDGSILAVDVVSGGFGYQYPPIVEVKDKCNIGVGAVTRAVLGEVTETVEYYDQEEDFEEYELCDPTDVGYGLRYGPDGKSLGPWEPSLYANLTQDPIAREIKEYQDFLQQLQNPWWTTRKEPPLRLTSGSKTTRTKFDVTDKTFLEYARSNGDKNPVGWNDFMNSYAISPVPPSNVKGSDFAGIPFTFEWEEEFPYDGEYIFRGLCDNKAELYLDNLKLDDLRSFRDSPNAIKKNITAGVHRIRLDLLNLPVKNTPTTVTTTTSVSSNLKLKFTQKGSNYYIEASGTGSGEALIVMEVNDAPYIAGLAAREVIIPSDSGKLKFERKGVIKIGAFVSDIGVEKNETIKKKGTFTAGKIYGPIEIVGATAGAGTPKVSNNKLALLDTDGIDENIKIIIADIKNTVTSSTSSSSSSTLSQNVKVTNIFNTIDYINKADRTLWRTFPSVGKDGDFIHQYGVTPFNPNTTEANTNSFAGTHLIRWENVNFPVDGNYVIETMVDDNVTLYIGNRNGEGRSNIGNGLVSVEEGGDEIIIRKQGFSGPGKSTGKSTQTKFFKAGKYRIRAELEQIKGKPLAQGNPMALAINITPAFTQQNIVSGYSWNENPMGVALTIDAPMPPIPQEPIVLQEGRCPNNPIWTTRFPNGKEKWWPVKFDSTRWSKFMNRYAISPVAPFSRKGTDGGGIVYRNSWNLDIPYDGFYALRGTVDNFGKILIDGKEISGVGKKGSTQSVRLDGFNVENPSSTKIFLTKGKHTIDVEVENEKTETYQFVDKKIFNTADWVVSTTQTNVTANIKPKFIQKNNKIYLEVSGSGTAEVEIVMDVNDAPYIAGLAAREVIIPSESGKLKFTRKGSITIGAFVSDIGIEKEETIKNIGTFVAGKTYGPIEIIGATSGAGSPKVTDNKIGLLDADGTDENIKIVITNVKNSSSSSKTTTGGLTSGNSKDGITYSGPTLASYRSGALGPFLTPAFTTDEDYRTNNMGKRWTLRWTGVDFPEDGRYELKTEADDEVIIRVDGQEVGKAKVFDGVRNYTFNATKGKKTIEMELYNIPGNSKSTFSTNPVVFNAVITIKVNTATGVSRSWTENPMGISAILIPPPCPKKIRGKGVVTDVIIDDPGNGFPRPGTGDYPVALRLKNVVVEDPGINYSCGIDQIQITPSNGAILDYECDTFGRIVNVKVLNPGLGFTRYPDISMVSPPGVEPTGINATFRPQFEVVRDPIVTEPQKLIQVTDLVGLKQTGYVDGRAYYGAVFYKDGIRYAGFYETPGDLVQVYDTLQESIDSQVVTRPSAIQRQGTDVTSNDPRLNIPGTPENLI